MWTNAEEVPKDTADEILARYDQTTPELQRLIVLQAFLDKENLHASLRNSISDTNSVLKFAGEFHAIHTVFAAAKQVIRHWDEFGPEHEFDAVMDRLRNAVGSERAATEAGPR